MGDLILTRNVVPGGASNVLADTALVRSVGVFDDSFMTLADWVLWTRLGLAAPLATVDRPLHGYYVHAGSMAHDVRRTEWELRLLGRKSADTRRQRSVALDWAQMRQYLGAWALRQGDRRAAARLHCQLALSREDRPLRSVSACLVVFCGRACRTCATTAPPAAAARVANRGGGVAGAAAAAGRPYARGPVAGAGHGAATELRPPRSVMTDVVRGRIARRGRHAAWMAKDAVAAVRAACG